MAIHRLTQAKVNALIRKGEDGLHGDGGGLWLQISNSGAWASWIFRYTRLGRERRMGLGSVGTITIGAARDAALAARRVLHAGGDPLAQRKLNASRDQSFDAAVADYLKAHALEWGNPKQRKAWASTLARY